jgi:hypothetical protein
LYWPAISLLPAKCPTPQGWGQREYTIFGPYLSNLTRKSKLTTLTPTAGKESQQGQGTLAPILPLLYAVPGRSSVA